jgi:hypothetical protein
MTAAVNFSFFVPIVVTCPAFSAPRQDSNSTVGMIDNSPDDDENRRLREKGVAVEIIVRTHLKDEHRNSPMTSSAPAAMPSTKSVT